MRLFATASALALVMGTAAFADTIKMSRSGVCYAPQDVGYADILPASEHQSMADCTQAGGWSREQGIPSRQDGANPRPAPEVTAPAANEILIVPHTFLWHSHRAAQAAALAREREALDTLHGVTPEERAAGPSMEASSYPEKTFIPAVPLGRGGFHFPVPIAIQTEQHTFGGYNTVENTMIERPASVQRPPIALPGAYRGGVVVREEAWNGQTTIGRVAPPGSLPADQGGALGAQELTTEEALDELANQMEAQGIMPPGFAPGTAPDVNDMLSAQGLDPSQFPGFDGDPSMLGLGNEGVSFTVGN